MYIVFSKKNAIWRLHSICHLLNKMWEQQASSFLSSHQIQPNFHFILLKTREGKSVYRRKGQNSLFVWVIVACHVIRLYIQFFPLLSLECLYCILYYIIISYHHISGKNMLKTSRCLTNDKYYNNIHKTIQTASHKTTWDPTKNNNNMTTTLHTTILLL